MTTGNAIESLVQDHERVRGLMNRIDATTSRGASTRLKLLAQLEMELKIHSKVEEEVFYPAFLDAARNDDERQLFFRSTEEHHIVDMFFPEIKANVKNDEQFRAKMQVLRELIEHHAGEEEKEMFPRARTLFDRNEMANLSTAAARRREKLLAQWKNPLTRPLKKIHSAVEKVVPTAVKNAKGKLLAAAAPSRRKVADRGARRPSAR